MLAILRAHHPQVDDEALNQADLLLQAVFDQTLRASSMHGPCTNTFRAMLEKRANPVLEWLSYQAASQGTAP